MPGCETLIHISGTDTNQFLRNLIESNWKDLHLQESVEYKCKFGSCVKLVLTLGGERTTLNE